MIIATGRTFEHRDLLRDMGGYWSKLNQRWQFDRLSAGELVKLRSLVGVMVTVEDDPEPFVFAPPPPREPRRSIIVGDDPSFHNYFADQDPIAFFGFSSLGAFVDYVDALPVPIQPGGEPSKFWSDSAKMQKWSGTRDMAEAIDLARHGWTDGAALTPKLTTEAATRPRRTRSLAGGAVSVGRMLAGDPMHMTRRTPQPRDRFVRLFVETIMWKNIGVAMAIWRALIVAAMIDLLEREGYRCEIVAVACSLNLDYEPESQLAVRIKDANDRLNLLDITFALGHPSFTRRFLFGAERTLYATDDDNSLISQAFTDDHPPGRNEFYIPQIPPLVAMKVDMRDPMAMLPFIVPDGLPIQIKGVQ